MDRREAIEILRKRRTCALYDSDAEALDIAIEALEREIEYGQMVVDLTKGEKVDDWVYDEDESATTTDCNYTCSDCKHQDKTYEQEPCHSCFNNDGAGYEPDTDCISRQQAIEEIKNAATITGWNIFASQEVFISAIKALPPVTPTERTGEWIEDGYYDSPCRVCSYCGYEHLNQQEMWKFCPNCGADMRGDE